MRILITTDLFTVTTNGVVTSVRNLCDQLCRDGHDVRILTLSANHRSCRSGNVYYIRSAPLGRIYPDVRMPTSFRHRLIRELVAWKPDVIHSQCEFFTFQYAQWIAKQTGAPLVHTYHTLYEQYVSYLLPGKRLGKRVVRVLSRTRLKRVNRIIAPTRKVEDALHGYGIRKPISVVPSGIDLAQHLGRIPEEERLEGRRHLGIRPEQTVLINLGRLGTEKNLEELLRLFAAALTRKPDLMFLLVGDGPAREGLERMSRELGIADRVIFTGMVDPGQVQRYYQLGDVFVSASTSETQGLTYIEAAANGLPLLCRSDPCLQEVLLDGQNGYAYTTEAEFLEAVEKLAGDPQLRDAAGRRSREIAASFDKSSFSASVETIYAGEIGGASAAGR